MKTFRPNKEAYILVSEEGKKTRVRVMKNEEFDNYNPTILDIGDLRKKSKKINAICAVFDLQGFTNFCNQMDPELSVPAYISGFLDWIFGVIRSETVEKQFPEGVKLWHSAPFYAKILGDGLLILWDTSKMHVQDQHNLIVSMDEICERYLNEFLPTMKRKVNEPPSALRCGLTKGTVYSVGDGNDFVGACINFAGRLQKLPGVIFTFALRGFDPEANLDKLVIPDYVLKKVPIRGMGNEELIYIRKKDFNKMSKDDKASYHNP